ncbi:hypothetical protein GCM10022254_33310 [Actinomadura meridiana]|uniref:AAA+ ATPase domain-containing protein n=1 Tax=Actinomadura meridiana TaxID=559626 RepID=A0ABP8C2P5_9ACTN
MNRPQPQPEPRGSARNPFPDVPEVRLDGDGGFVQVETDAVRAVRLLALDFLTSRPDVGGYQDLRRSGRVAAILGDYGVGKSHLARTLMDEVGRIAGTRPVVLVASGQPKDTVLSIYRRLLAPPGSGSGGRIRPVDTAAGVLLFGAVEKMVEALSVGPRGAAGPDAPPPTASDDLPVDRVWDLRARLAEIVGEDADVATVLGLVWHSSAGAAAWRWLRGDQDQTEDERRLLADRGVESPPVDTSERAIQVLRALARLCGATGGRMVLVLDELHQMRPQRGDGLTETAVTLMELIGWAGDTGALLAVCGLLDFWEALPQSVRGRVPVARIVPSGLTKAQIGAYIDAARHPDDPEPAGAPVFTDKAVEELWKIAEGHPRRTITLCHHAYDLARGGLIGPRQVQEAGRALCAPDTPDHVREKLFRWCTELGYHVRRAARDQPSRREPDLRVGSRHGDGACALVVSGPVVEKSELDDLHARGFAVAGRGAEPGRDVVLVMAGSLAAAYTREVEDLFAHVLYWDSDTFRDDLAATLHSYVSAGDLAAMNAGLYDLVLDMRREIRELGAGAPVAAPVPADTAAGTAAKVWTDPDRRVRFEEADRRCRDALEFLGGAHGKAHEFWRGRFHIDAKGPSVRRDAASGERPVALSDATGIEIRLARGTLLFLEDAVRELAQLVHDLLADEARPLWEIRGDLRYLTTKFDHSVRDLIQLFPDRNSIAGRFLGVSQPRLKEHLAGLGETVYSVVVTARSKDGT